MKLKRFIMILPVMLMTALMLSMTASASFKSESRESVVVVATCLDLDAGEYFFGWGTGFFVGKSGEDPTYLVTNYHVVEDFLDYGEGDLTDYKTNTGETLTGRSKIRAYYDSKEYVEAYYVAGNKIKDIALLKLDKPTSKRKPLPLCVPTEDMVGSSIFAVGYPGLSENLDAGATSSWGMNDATVTSGSISRLFTTAGTGVNHVQIDCVIRHGNSGGPLLNDKGEVLGVTTWFEPDFDDEQIYYAVSINEVIPFLKNNNVDYELGSDSITPEEDPNPPAPAVPTEPTTPTQEEKGMSTGLIVGLSVGGAALVILIVAVIVLISKRSKAVAAANAAPPAAPAQKPWQQVRRPVVRSMTGMKAEITGQQILIGRSVNDCALVFPEGTPGVSGRHCSLSWDGRTGEFTLTDLKSTYGTYLQNGQKLTPGVPYKLRVGDGFYLGERTNLLNVTME